MAPSGYKTFAAAAVLRATEDLQNYLMDQAVTVHADNSARASAISSPAEGQVSYLKDTNKVYVYTTSWEEVGGGIAWSGSTANGIGTYSSASEIVAESSATYDGTTLALTTSGGGLKLDGLNSSNVNTLDDYEEGTWTATFSSGGGSITINGSYNTGSYIKIGKLVHVQLHSNVASVSSPTGGAFINGLPFTSVAGVAVSQGYNHLQLNVGYLGSSAISVGGTDAQLAYNSTQIGMTSLDAYTTATAMASKFAANTEVYLTGTYIANV